MTYIIFQSLINYIFFCYGYFVKSSQNYILHNLQKESGIQTLNNSPNVNASLYYIIYYSKFYGVVKRDKRSATSTLQQFTYLILSSHNYFSIPNSLFSAMLLSKSYFLIVISGVDLIIDQHNLNELVNAFSNTNFLYFYHTLAYLSYIYLNNM